MADTFIYTGPMVDDLGLIVNVQSPKPPFQHGVGIHAKAYVVDTDFPSGNDVVFRIKNCPGVRYAHFTNNVGETVAYVKAAYAAGYGFQFTLAAQATDIQAYIVFDI